MSPQGWVAVVAAGGAVALWLPGLVRVPISPPAITPRRGDGWMHRRQPLWSLLAAVAAICFVPGPTGWAAGAAVAASVWVLVGRAVPAPVRREREAVRRDLPHVVGLLAGALRAGQAPADAAAAVVDALPGPATRGLSGVVPRLRLGVDPETVWTGLATEPGLEALGRTLARAHRTGASVTVAVERLADELARDGRAAIEDRARAVGVRAAVPLGMCLLPAFVLLGIVPVVAGLLGTLGI